MFSKISCLGDMFAKALMLGSPPLCILIEFDGVVWLPKNAGERITELSAIFSTSSIKHIWTLFIL